MAPENDNGQQRPASEPQTSTTGHGGPHGGGGEQQPSQPAPSAGSGTSPAPPPDSAAPAAVSERPSPTTVHRERRPLLAALAAGVSLVAAIVFGLDALQNLLEQSYTAIDLLPPPPYELAGSVPFNVLQTAGLLFLATLLAVLAALTAAHRGGVARIGGLLALLAVFAVPVQLLGINVLALSVHTPIPERQWRWGDMDPFTVLPILYALVTGISAVLALLAAVLLGIGAFTSRPLVRPGRAGILLGIGLTVPLLLEALLVLIRTLGPAPHDLSWWAIFGSGVLAPITVRGTIILEVVLLLVLALGAVGATLLIGARPVLARIGGALVLIGVLLPCLLQYAAGGIGGVTTRWLMESPDWWRIIPWTDLAQAILVLLALLLGLALAVVGAIQARSRTGNGPRPTDDADRSTA